MSFRVMSVSAVRSINVSSSAPGGATGRVNTDCGVKGATGLMVGGTGIATGGDDDSKGNGLVVGGIGIATGGDDDDSKGNGVWGIEGGPGIVTGGDASGATRFCGIEDELDVTLDDGGFGLWGIEDGLVVLLVDDSQGTKV